MDLNFELQGGYFIAEFEVTSDFNLHIEKDPIGQFIVYQRTAGGAYDLVADFGKNKGDDSVIDYDFSALVYPKYIQIKSSVKPVVATITTDGEVNELVYQEKSINITSNGEVAISADSGYNGLAKVNVKVDVPQNSGGEKVRYFNIQKMHEQEDTKNMIGAILCLCTGLVAVKYIYSLTQSFVICPIASLDASVQSEITQIAMLDDFRGFITSGSDINSSQTIQELLSFGCTEITKEEFYNLNV